MAWGRSPTRTWQSGSAPCSPNRDEPQAGRASGAASPSRRTRYDNPTALQHPQQAPRRPRSGDRRPARGDTGRNPRRRPVDPRGHHGHPRATQHHEVPDPGRRAGELIMADPIEQELKKHSRQNEKIITLLETLVSLAGGHLPQQPEDTRIPEQIRAQVSVVPRGRIRPRYTAAEQQMIHPHEREP